MDINHGVMVVGKSGTGKSMAWNALFKALERIEGKEGHIHLIDPKSVAKDKLYGWLDVTTREWTDGIFTKILRNIIDDIRGEGLKRHWIVFDGDVDPEWVENLNSVLDDNKMLTLPNGERLPLPSNVRILFEVDNLDQATPATVSRCGMVWFPDTLITPTMLTNRYLSMVTKIPVDEIPMDYQYDITAYKFSPVSPIQLQAIEILKALLGEHGVLNSCLQFALGLDQIMEFSYVQALENFFSLINASIKVVLNYESTHLDIPIEYEKLESYLQHSFYIHMAWSLGGNLDQTSRKKLGQFIQHAAALAIDGSIFDYDTSLVNSSWITWKSQVPLMNVDPKSIFRQDIVVPTIDTLRHEKILYSWLAEHRSVILCGPPGSGKVIKS